MNAEEEPGKRAQQTAGVWAQASEERFAEITSGESWWQPGLVATGKDFFHEAMSRRGEEPLGLANESVVARNGE